MTEVLGQPVHLGWLQLPSVVKELPVSKERRVIFVLKSNSCQSGSRL